MTDLTPDEESLARSFDGVTAPTSTSAYTEDAAGSGARYGSANPASRRAAIAGIAAVVVVGASFGAVFSLRGHHHSASDYATPQGRNGAAMAYDPATQTVILFGGNVGNGPGTSLNDTWEWDGTGWAQLHPAHSPSSRANGQFAFDPATKHLVLYGGLHVSHTATTQQICPALEPNGPATVPGVLPVDDTSGNTSSGSGSSSGGSGGSGSGGGPGIGNSKPLPCFVDPGIQTSQLEDTWTFDGDDWTQTLADKLPGYNTHIATDTALGHLYAVTENPVAYASSGTVCAVPPVAPGASAPAPDPSCKDTTTSTPPQDSHANGPQIYLFDNGRWVHVDAAGEPPTSLGTIVVTDPATGHVGVIVPANYYCPMMGTATGGAPANSAVGTTSIAPDYYCYCGTEKAQNALPVQCDPSPCGVVSSNDTKSSTSSNIACPAPGGPAPATTCGPAQNCVGTATLKPASARVCLPGMGAVCQGGCCPSAIYVFDGHAWSHATVATYPSIAIATTEDGDVIALDGNGSPGTYQFKNGAWIQLTPKTSPPPLYGAAMAYDAVRHQTIVFGGYVFNQGKGIVPARQNTGGGVAEAALPVDSDATWIWNGSDWKRFGGAAPTPTPVPATTTPTAAPTPTCASDVVTPASQSITAPKPPVTPDPNASPDATPPAPTATAAPATPKPTTSPCPTPAPCGSDPAAGVCFSPCSDAPPQTGQPCDPIATAAPDQPSPGTGTVEPQGGSGGGLNP